MASQSEENETLLRVQLLSEREQEPAFLRLTWNRVRILLEKCYLTNRGFGMIVECFIPILFAWYIKGVILRDLAQLNKINGTTPTPNGPLYPPSILSSRITYFLDTNHYYMLKPGAESALVDEFIESVQNMNDGSLTTLNFTKVDNITSVDWKSRSTLSFYRTRLLLLFDEKFNRKNLVYKIVRPDLLKENLNEKWSLLNDQKPYTNENIEVFMHYRVAQAFRYWTKNENAQAGTVNLHPFELDDYYTTKANGISFHIDCSPEMVEFYSYVFCLLIITTLMSFHTIVCKEAKDKSKEFLKLIGATNAQILAVNTFYFAIVVSIMMIPPLIYFYIGGVFDNMPLWPIFLQLLQLYIGTGIHVQLLTLILPNLTFCRLLLLLHITMSCFSVALKDTWWYWPLFYPGPFFSFHVNWRLSFDALYGGGPTSKLFQANSYLGNLSWFGSYTLSWLIIGFNFLFLLYLTEVYPLQHGNIRPFYYIFNKNYWLPNRQANAKINPMPAQNSQRFELPQTSPIISIRSLLKGFRSSGPPFKWRPVIENLNFDFHDNQITALLGFNGAGKSTLIDMITGMKTIDGGQIQVSGKNVQNQTAQVRKRLSLCPQENIFYGKLTVGQNIRLAAVMKGIAFKNAHRKTEVAASLVNLKDQINKKADDLSGGMKRRLCLACAIIGNWETLILDEPTSGIDPETRHDIWDLLLQIRKVRTIILTTHFIEEADVLADRIAIMAKGEIVCAGSAPFLKRAYQTGYVLNLLTKAGCNRQSLLREIQNFVPNAVLYGEKTSELTVQLLGSAEHDNEKLNEAMASLFRWLEGDEGQEYVQSFIIGNTSLEDVFLKVGEEGKGFKHFDSKNSLNGVYNPAFDDISLAEQIGDPDNILLFNRPKGVQRIWVQVQAIMYKRLCYLIQQFVVTLRMIVLPLLFTFFLVSAVNFFYDKYIATGQSKDVKVDFKEVYPQTKTLFSSDEHPDSKARLQRYVDKATAMGLNPFVLPNDNANLTTYVLDRATQTNNPEEFAFGMTFERGFLFNCTLWPNYIYRYSLPAAISFLLSEEADENDSTAHHKINLGFHWIPFKADIQEYLTFTSISLGAMVQVLLIALVYIGTNALTSTQEELKRLAFFMQQVAGVSKNVYWATNLLFDYLYFAACVSSMLLLLEIVDRSGLFSFSEHAYDIATLFLSGFGLVAYAYFFVRLLYKTKYLTTLYTLYIIIGMIAPVIALFINEAMKNPISDTKQVIIFAFCPQAAFLYSFVRIVFQNGVKMCVDAPCPACSAIYDEVPSMFKEDGFYMYITLSAAIFMVIINSCDYITDPICKFVVMAFEMVTKRKQYNDGEGLRHQLKIDQEIIKENLEIQEIVQTGDFRDNVLVASNLRKKFGNVFAVNDISFKIRNQECFGLLGLNGAGKSTTFNMLVTGSITSGQVFLKRNHLKPTKMPFFYELLSYCPQTECHFKDLTVLQIILFYLRVQGSPPSFTFRIAKRIIELTDLQDYSNSKADNLSGGNKRKLSLAIALISVKSLILLDEPTTGVDPMARRKIWHCLNLHRRIGRCTYLLTSHSLDECETLCDRIAIMANGKLRCLGTASQLKQNYAQGFQITLKLEFHRVHDNLYVEMVKSRLKIIFPENIEFQEMHMNTMDFILKDSNVPWSELFARMQLLSKELQLLDFVIKATTLEQVFLSFAD